MLLSRPGIVCTSPLDDDDDAEDDADDDALSDDTLCFHAKGGGSRITRYISRITNRNENRVIKGTLPVTEAVIVCIYDNNDVILRSIGVLRGVLYS